jgi:2-methylcitrate dehydratase PrpD
MVEGPAALHFERTGLRVWRRHHTRHRGFCATTDRYERGLFVKSYTERFADFAAGVNFTDLSQTAVTDCKRLILDTIACTVASHTTDAGKIVVDVRGNLGGAPQSTILVTGQKTSALNAVYVNAALANLMDYDDIMCHAGGHFAQSAVFPALAIAEHRGSSGKDLITAVAVGFEMVTRIGNSMRRNNQYNPETDRIEITPTAGQSWAVFAAVGAAGKLMQFDGERMATAMGLAGYSAPIPTIGKYIFDRAEARASSPEHSPVAMSKYTLYGPLAEAGLMGALLAEGGFTGDRAILDGKAGFWRLVGNSGFDYENMMRGLGETWNVSETSLKPYPTGRDFQSPVTVFEKLMDQHQFAAGDIEAIEVELISQMAEHMNHSYILNQIDTQFSLPYALAMIALKKPAGPEWERKANFADPDVRRVMDLVSASTLAGADEFIRKEQEDGSWRGAFPSRVTVRTRNGSYTGEGAYSRGDPWYPEYRMTDEQLERKFRYAAQGQLDDRKIDAALELAFNLENVANVDALVANLA